MHGYGLMGGASAPRHAAQRPDRAARRQPPQRRDPAAPALRHADPAPPLRPLHAGDGRRDLRLHAGAGRPGRRALCANSGRERTSAIVYAVGWTQHTTGVQIIRAAGILQLLLGNMGRPGGGIMAMRGHASIQGSTDIPTLYDLLPGYLPQPAADEAPRDARRLRRVRRPADRLLGEHRSSSSACSRPGTATQRRPDERLPLRLAAADRRRLLAAALLQPHGQGRGEGLLPVRPEPGGGGPNAGLHRAGLRKLDWLVVADWFETETRVLLEERPEGAAAVKMKTEVFFIPGGRDRGEGRHASPTPSGCSSGTTKPSIRRGLPLGRVVRLSARQAAEALYADSTDPRDQPSQPDLGLRL